MSFKFFSYSKCSTCQKAKKFLLANKVDFQEVDIILNPPSISELQAILDSGIYQITDLFNKSGEMYRELNMKDKIKILSKEELLDLLSKNGKLVKRPILSDGKRFAVGFKEDFWTDNIV